MPLILPGNVGSATAATGFNVANSCRFDDGSSDDLQKNFGTSTNTDIFTISIWVKRSTLGINNFFVYSTGGNSDDNWFQVGWNTTDKFVISAYNTVWLRTNRLFRDVSAWYHIVIKADSSQGTASNRLKLYVNGVEETSFSDDNRGSISSSQTWGWNKTGNTGYVGSKAGNNYYDGYMAEVVMIDGTALDPTSFGEFDSDSAIWKPINVSGLTFGTNGFYLDFEDSSALGNDASGSNNYTVNNLTAIDQSIDTCTNNFCTVNPLDNYHQQATYSEGNTKITFKGPSSYYAWSTGTFGMANGKWYWETKATSAGNHNVYGISGRVSAAYNHGLGKYTDTYGYYNYNGNYTNASTDGTYAENSFSGGNVTWTTNDIIGIALDLDSGTNTVKFYKNNALIGTVNIIAPSSGFYYPAWNQFDNQAEVCQPNFGSPSYAISSGNADANGYGNFEYAPPSGYFALCSKNLAEYG